MHVYHSQQNTKQYYFLWISWCVPINLDTWKVLYAQRCVAFFKFVLCLTNTKKKARTSGNQYNLLKKGIHCQNSCHIKSLSWQIYNPSWNRLQVSQLLSVIPH